MTTNRFHSRARLALLGLAVLAAGALLSACGDDDAEAKTSLPQQAAAAAQQATRLGVQLNEWGVVLSTNTFRSGKIAIAAANTGALPHDLVLVRSDAPLKGLPIKENRVDESAISIAGRFQEFKSGEKEKQFDLEKGRYLLICNIATHYEQGMVAELKLN